MVPRTIRLVARLRAAAWLAALAAGACRGSAPIGEPGPAAPTDRCLLPTGEPGASRELIVAAGRLGDSMIVARRMPRPLIRIDCVGAAQPATAASWTSDSSRRSWTFVLATATVSLTAADVAAEWRTRPDAATTLRLSGVASVVPLDGRRLVVTLDRPTASVPRLFADPSLGVVTDSLPPTGTRFVALRPAASDPRDALDGGADLLRTSDPAVAEYARNRSEFIAHPLPWSRTYVLVMPPGREGPGDLIPADSATFRAGLARDAVRAEARGAEPPFWWNGMGPCAALDVPPPPLEPLGADVVVYDREDPIARALAERVVGIAHDGTMAATGLPETRMADVLRGGLARAYVVAVPRVALVPCREVARWPAGSVVIPLIDTRASVIARRGVPPLTVEFDGTLRPADWP